MDIHFKFSLQYEKALNPEGGVTAFEERCSKMKAFWDEELYNIKKIFEEITGLKFADKIIPCYLNSVFTISDPLSLKIEDIDDMKDNLLHELCHVLFMQNTLSKNKGWQEMLEAYKDEPFVTQVHSAIHALHYLVTKELRPERLENIMNYSKKQTYIKAWEIVNEKTPQYFIDLITKK